MDIIEGDSDDLLRRLQEVDYSFMVRYVAEPPFDGPDIRKIRRVSPFRKAYELPVDGYRSYLASPESAIFIGMQESQVVGFVAVSRLWNDFAQIDDVCVDAKARGTGIGTALLARAVKHASRLKLSGVRAETQSLNVPACRFYRKNGFCLGGFDRFHYGARSKEIALFWYLLRLS
jgi:ribosomal protein S18 acetylase RimI-like enzyme